MNADTSSSRNQPQRAGRPTANHAVLSALIRQGAQRHKNSPQRMRACRHADRCRIFTPCLLTEARGGGTQIICSVWLAQ
jgi:hypothetical protein